MHSMKMQITASTKQLERYEAVGSGFMALVKQYSTLLDQLNDKQWALDQLTETPINRSNSSSLNQQRDNRKR